MRTLFRTTLVALMALAGAAACQSTATKWQHPTVAQDHWSADAAQCRYEARREAEERLVEAGALSESSSSQELTVNQMMSQDKVSDRAEIYFKACMTALGYEPVQR